MYRKLTLRRMPPVTRKVAKLLAQLESVEVKLRHLLPELQTQELMARGEGRRAESLAHRYKAKLDALTARCLAPNNAFEVVARCASCEYLGLCGDDSQRPDYCPIRHEDDDEADGQVKEKFAGEDAFT